MSRFEDIPVAHAIHDIPTTIFTSATNTATSASAPQLIGVNEAAVRDYLAKKQWPYGLTDAVVEGLRIVPIRSFICDDSGSMNEGDGKRVVYSTSDKKFQLIRCTRWAELTQALTFHVELAEAAGIRTEFRMLNSAPPLEVSIEHPESVEILKNIFMESPSGGTPLCRHIREVIEQIRPYAAILQQQRQKACIIIATDGESSDGDIAAAMKPLEQLPVWVVVRLCTNDEKIVNYWNEIDKLIEVDMDVIDDFEGEAKEIFRYNPWLTYGEPLHRIREFGITLKALDLIDEDYLTGDAIMNLASIVIGGRPSDYPNPQSDGKAFMTIVRSRQGNIPEVWDPISQRLQPWFKRKELAKALAVKDDCIIM